MGKTDEVLHALCPNTVKWEKSRLLNRESKEEMKAWVDSIVK